MSAKGLLISVGVATLFVVGGVVTLGLPGAVLFTLNAPVLWLLFGADALDKLPPDSYWPIALVMTLLWPASIVAGYLVAFWLLRGASRVGRWGSFAAVLVVWSDILATACYMLGRQA